MILQLSLAQDFGAQLGDGSRAAEYRAQRIDPNIVTCDEIVFDFTGVRTANSSFVNALVTAIAERHGERILDKLTFKGCNRTVRVLVEGAIDLGLQKRAERAAA